MSAVAQRNKKMNYMFCSKLKNDTEVKKIPAVIEDYTKNSETLYFIFLINFQKRCILLHVANFRSLKFYRFAWLCD